MPIAAGQLLELTIEKPAAGGSMIARAEGQVVLVSGTLPGERVEARIDRVGKGVAFAHTTRVLEPSADRREAFVDLRCGGSLYAHIAYPRQVAIKGAVIADAFARLGRLALPGPLHVSASPEEGYRMRARMHWRGGRAGLFREGSHDLCDARATRQLLPATCDAVAALADVLVRTGVDAVRELEVSENIAASERAVHLDTAAHVDPDRLVPLAGVPGFTGVSAGVGGAAVIGGSPYVSDTLQIGGSTLTLRRHACAFFQGNRFLLTDLVEHVTRAIPVGSTVADLYAGVGLFSIGAAAIRGATVTAVEGDRIAADDLTANARASAGGVIAVHQAVEVFLEQTRSTPHVVIVDPPRTGLSRAALHGILELKPATLIYVSCDVATLARDARRIVDAGYVLDAMAAFDLFPNTPHVETVAQFVRG